MSEAQRKVPQADYAAIVSRYASGITLVQIAEDYGVTGEGIRLIIKKVDSSKIGSSRKVIAEQARSKLRAAADERSMGLWGMPKDEFKQHIALFGGRRVNGSPVHRFVAQRQNAKTRGIAWELTFADWWKIWHESGKWQQRGCHLEDFVMARHGDLDTPYSKDTVYICTSLKNIRDGFVSTPAGIRYAKRKNSACNSD